LWPDITKPTSTRNAIPSARQSPSFGRVYSNRQRAASIAQAILASAISRVSFRPVRTPDFVAALRKVDTVDTAMTLQQQNRFDRATYLESGAWIGGARLEVVQELRANYLKTSTRDDSRRCGTRLAGTASRCCLLDISAIRHWGLKLKPSLSMRPPTAQYARALAHGCQRHAQQFSS